ncbi:hypothetical protein AYJ57_21635 (plasmid) [Salipiger sp. CCB-MM3]|uniref:hypothetical protein n=1 Tax=Salipiger sp. CCB-MM3 TaxID=1792508 RepID=UPI00080AB628|nr:hypothetical protein [Salipiger sp. CCB-MM3]ANT63076.1 hypothetical protein AYJ57_21635 [Salipiger sp. CCB-MM3]
METRSATLAVGSEKQQCARTLYQDHNVQWSWMNGAYEPSPTDFARVESISSPSNALSRSDSDIRKISQVTRELADLTGNGEDESIVRSRIIPDCTGTNICPVLVYDSDGNKIGDFLSYAGQLGLSGDDLYTFGRYGFSSYAFDGQTYSHKETFTSLAVPG